MIWRERHIIDSFKGLTAPFVLGLMAFYGAWASPAAWLYLAVHGTYGVLWVLKSRLFGDKSWERPLTVFSTVKLTVGLAGYWIGPVLLIRSGRESPPALAALGVALFGFGVFLHFAADMQKTVALQHQPGLVSDRLWARTRNPNYLGELLIYAGFAVLSLHWQPAVWFALVIAAAWVPNMLAKDKSIARHPGFEAYKRRSGLLFPW